MEIPGSVDSVNSLCTNQRAFWGLKARLQVLLKVLIRLLETRLKVLLKVLIMLLKARLKVLLKVLIKLLKARLKVLLKVLISYKVLLRSVEGPLKAL